jgi:hypothetical protein
MGKRPADDNTKDKHQLMSDCFGLSSPDGLSPGIGSLI